MAQHSKYIIAIDCGSTTTKALLLAKEHKGERMRYLYNCQTPSTVEKPYEDITVGILAAIRLLERKTKTTLLQHGINGEIALHVDVAHMLVTSSAGGALQIMVAGVIKQLATEHAQGATTGTGAVVVDVLAMDDGRIASERMDVIHNRHPDLMLILGSIDGGADSHIIEICQSIYRTGLKPRFARQSQRVPIIYIGVRDYVVDILHSTFNLRMVEDTGSGTQVEKMPSVRQEVRKLFMNHVMTQAPNFEGLQAWVSEPILPTPEAMGFMVKELAQNHHVNVLGVDIGSATTDVFTVVKGQFHRSISANLGMGYSANGVLAAVGVDNICRWLATPYSNEKIKNIVANRMIRPSLLPETTEELIFEHALAREAIRLALVEHIDTVNLVAEKGNHAQSLGGIKDTALIDVADIRLIIGSGGVLSHAPRTIQAALILIDACRPCGVTQLALDKGCIMAQLGMVGQRYPHVIQDLSPDMGLIDMGTVLAPIKQEAPVVQEAPVKQEAPIKQEACLLSSRDTLTVLADITISGEDGGQRHYALRKGILEVVPLNAQERYTLLIQPMGAVDMGAGLGKAVIHKVRGGRLGLFLDGRAPRLDPVSQHDLLCEHNLHLFRELNIYDIDAMHDKGGE